MTDDKKARETCANDYYDAARKEFVCENAEGRWVQHGEGGYKRILASRWLSKKIKEDSGDPLSQVERAMYDAVHHRTLEYSGLLAGWEKGVHTVPGVGRVLVTRGPELIKPVAGDWPNLHNFMSSLLRDHPAQYSTLMGWLHVAITSLYAHKFRPGQAVALCGPRDCGKSLLQQLLTVMFGGRMARPYQFMSGRTDFNADLFQGEHLIIEDDAPSTRLDDRRNLGSKLKEITDTEGQRLHSKGRDAVILPVFWRITISCNDEPENLMMLPPIDASLEDKLIIFRAQRAELPFDTTDGDGREKTWKALVGELPAFIAHLLAHKIDPAQTSGRFGVKSFAHPEILKAIAELAPESRLAEIIDHELFATMGLAAAAWEGTTGDLERRLVQSETVAYDARKLLTFNTAVGVYLARLAIKHPKRYEKRHTSTNNFWTINPPETLKNENEQETTPLYDRGV